tara:strand:- start:68 stop:373 length:306 start_codon:yes stop_codon:yes gene_type:complete
MSQDAAKAGFRILKMGAIRPGDEFRSPGRLYQGRGDAPECAFCGRDAYETELESFDGGGVHFFFCLDCEQEAAYEGLSACRSQLDSHITGDQWEDGKKWQV